MTYIKGIGAALITPFNSDYSIDFTSLEKLINHVIQGGIDFLVVLGTTGESVVLSKEEKEQIINFCKEINDKRVPIVLGLGGNNTLSLVKEIKETEFNGIDAILSVSPYYNKPTQDGIYLHYKLISEASSLPIILYNVPSRTGSNIKAKTTLRLANEFNNIIAIKEASGDLDQIHNILQNKPNNFSVLSGDDALTYEMIKMGASGVIAVISQAFPKHFTNMVNAAINKDFTSAEKINKFLTPLYKPLYVDGNPAGIKAALHSLDIIENFLRPPLVPVSKNTHSNLIKALKIISLK